MPRKSPFSLGNKLGRLSWTVVYALLFRWLPRPLHGVRASMLRLFGARIGRGVRVYPKVVIWAPWNLTIGESTVVADGAILYSQGRITLGRGVVISQGAHLCTGTHDYENPLFPLIAREITVEDLVWVSAEAFVHPGVTIHEGAVIGARSVVTKDAPAWTVSTGNPCRAVKARAAFEFSKIKRTT